MTTEIDIKTGLPREMVKRSQKEARVESLMQDTDIGREVISALGSPSGSVLKKACIEILEKEIKNFVDKDPKCQTVMQILKSLGTKIEAHKRAAQMLIKEGLAE